MTHCSSACTNASRSSRAPSIIQNRNRNRCDCDWHAVPMWITTNTNTWLHFNHLAPFSFSITADGILSLDTVTSQSSPLSLGSRGIARFTSRVLSINNRKSPDSPPDDVSVDNCSIYVLSDPPSALPTQVYHAPRRSHFFRCQG